MKEVQLPRDASLVLLVALVQSSLCQSISTLPSSPTHTLGPWSFDSLGSGNPSQHFHAKEKHILGCFGTGSNKWPTLQCLEANSLPHFEGTVYHPVGDGISGIGKWKASSGSQGLRAALFSAQVLGARAPPAGSLYSNDFL